MMNRRLLSSLATIVCLAFVSCAFAQTNVVVGGGGASVSTATAAVGLSGLDGIYANPSAIFNTENRMGFDVGVRSRFGLEELNTVSLAGYYKTQSGTFGLQLIRYGFDAFNEQKIGVTYARKLAKTVGFGASANLISVNIEEFGSKSVPTFDVGFTAAASRTLAISTSIQNFTSTTFGDELNIPIRILAATTYRPNDKVAWTVEFEKSVDVDFTIKTALLYEVLPSIQIRAGMDILREEFGVGIGYSIGQVKAIGAYSYDTLLGATPGLSLRYAK